MADFGMVNFEKVSTGWRCSCGPFFWIDCGKNVDIAENQ
jgi:hypothetical protein